MVNKTTTEGPTHVSVWFDGDLTSATVYDMETGLHATGHARRVPSDEYDPEIGEDLAILRASERLFNKLIRYTIRSLA
jgi:hypothetical protein